MKYELVFFKGGTATLTDDQDAMVWASDGDDEFAREFPDVLTVEDADDIVDYLEDEGYLPEDCALDIVESDDTGLYEILPGDRDEEDEDEDEDA